MPIVIGEPSIVLTPLVLGPNQIPVVTDSAMARRVPEIAVMSAIAHGAEPDFAPIFAALLAGLNAIDLDHADLYTDIVLATLPATAQKELEGLMPITRHRYQNEFVRRYFEQRELEEMAKGKANALLAFLDARGITVPADVHARILDCFEHDQLDTWIRRAATADKIEDLDG